jgi:hypothetical protein
LRGPANIVSMCVIAAATVIREGRKHVSRQLISSRKKHHNGFAESCLVEGRSCKIAGQDVRGNVLGVRIPLHDSPVTVLRGTFAPGMHEYIISLHSDL